MRLMVALAMVLTAGRTPVLAFDAAATDATAPKAQPAPVCCEDGDKPTTVRAHFTKALISPETPLVPAFTTGFNQLLTSHVGYSNHWSGNGQHYGAAVLGNVSGKFVERFALPGLFHQDESYFASGPGADAKARAGHVLEHLIWTRSDDHSRKRFNVSAVPGSFIMALAANTYVPQAQRTIPATGWRFLGNLGGFLLGDAFSEGRIVGDSSRPVARLCKKVWICH
jgi:hypothetical protein